MEPKEETGVLLIMSMHIYIFRKFNPCAENSPIFMNTNRMADTGIMYMYILYETVLSKFVGQSEHQSAGRNVQQKFSN